MLRLVRDGRVGTGELYGVALRVPPAPARSHWPGKTFI